MKNPITSKEACTIAHKIRRETGCSLADAFKAAYAGTNIVALKTHWTREELDQIFSDKAAELLRKGYMIDTKHMSGSQGEIAKLLFVKNGSHFQLSMVSKSKFRSWYTDHIIISFGKYTEEARVWDTLWMDRFDSSWSLEVVKITDNYFVTPELAEEFDEKRHNRLAVKYPNQVALMDDRYTKVILPLVRKQKGYKGTKLSDIMKVERITTVNYSGKPVRRYYKVMINKKNAVRPEIVNIHF